MLSESYMVTPQLLKLQTSSSGESQMSRLSRRYTSNVLVNSVVSEWMELVHGHGMFLIAMVGMQKRLFHLLSASRPVGYFRF